MGIASGMEGYRQKKHGKAIQMTAGIYLITWIESSTVPGNTARQTAYS